MSLSAGGAPASGGSTALTRWRRAACSSRPGWPQGPPSALRKRRGLMVFTALLTVGLPVLVLGLRLLFHAVDPKGYGPAGSPSVFQVLCQPMASFAFIIAATLVATAAADDLTDGT